MAWKFACILRTYKTCKSIVGFSKYEFNNKLLGIAHCLKLSQVELEHNYIYIYIYRERERERERFSK